MFPEILLGSLTSDLALLAAPRIHQCLDKYLPRRPPRISTSVLLADRNPFYSSTARRWLIAIRLRASHFVHCVLLLFLFSDSLHDNRQRCSCAIDGVKIWAFWLVAILLRPPTVSFDSCHSFPDQDWQDHLEIDLL